MLPKEVLEARGVIIHLSVSAEMLPQQRSFCGILAPSSQSTKDEEKATCKRCLISLRTWKRTHKV